MIDVSNFIQERLSASDSEAFVLLKIEMPEETLAYTDFGTNILRGGVSYQSRDPGALMSIDRPQSDDAVDRSEYLLTFSDLDLGLENSLRLNSSLGAQVTVEVGFVDPTTDQPEIDDTLIFYQGGLDNFVSEDDGDQRSLAVRVVSPMAALDYVNPITTSQDSIQRFDETDTSMDFLGSQLASEVTLNWGQK